MSLIKIIGDFFWGNHQEHNDDLDVPKQETIVEDVVSEDSVEESESDIIDMSGEAVMEVGVGQMDSSSVTTDDTVDEVIEEQETTTPDKTSPLYTWVKKCVDADDDDDDSSALIEHDLRPQSDSFNLKIVDMNKTVVCHKVTLNSLYEIYVFRDPWFYNFMSSWRDTDPERYYGFFDNVSISDDDAKAIYKLIQPDS